MLIQVNKYAQVMPSKGKQGHDKFPHVGLDFYTNHFRNKMEKIVLCVLFK